MRREVTIAGPRPTRARPALQVAMTTRPASAATTAQLGSAARAVAAAIVLVTAVGEAVEAVGEA